MEMLETHDHYYYELKRRSKKKMLIGSDGLVHIQKRRTTGKIKKTRRNSYLENTVFCILVLVLFILKRNSSNLLFHLIFRAFMTEVMILHLDILEYFKGNKFTANLLLYGLIFLAIICFLYILGNPDNYISFGDTVGEDCLSLKVASQVLNDLHCRGYTRKYMCQFYTGIMAFCLDWFLPSNVGIC